jgi:hypothetical protein
MVWHACFLPALCSCAAHGLGSARLASFRCCGLLIRLSAACVVRQICSTTSTFRCVSRAGQEAGESGARGFQHLPAPCSHVVVRRWRGGVCGLQVHGYKRFLLFPPETYPLLAPWPVLHPAQRSAQLDLNALKDGAERVAQQWPVFAEFGADMRVYEVCSRLDQRDRQSAGGAGGAGAAARLQPAQGKANGVLCCAAVVWCGAGHFGAWRCAVHSTGTHSHLTIAPPFSSLTSSDCAHALLVACSCGSIT